MPRGTARSSSGLGRPTPRLRRMAASSGRSPKTTPASGRQGRVRGRPSPYRWPLRASARGGVRWGASPRLPFRAAVPWRARRQRAAEEACVRTVDPAFLRGLARLKRLRGNLFESLRAQCRADRRAPPHRRLRGGLRVPLLARTPADRDVAVELLSLPAVSGLRPPSRLKRWKRRRAAARSFLPSWVRGLAALQRRRCRRRRNEDRGDGVRFTRHRSVLGAEGATKRGTRLCGGMPRLGAFRGNHEASALVSFPQTGEHSMLTDAQTDEISEKISTLFSRAWSSTTSPTS